MQSLAKPQLDQKQSHALWQTILGKVSERELDAPAFLAIILKLPLLCLLLAAGLYLAWHASGQGALFFACAGLALILAQFAFLGHDAGHGSLIRNKALNTTLGQFCMTVVTGLTFTEWYGRHRTHHQFCQHEPRDPDMDVDLVVSLTDASRERKTPLGRFFTKCQSLSVWLLSLFFAHSQRHLSQWGAIREPRKYAQDLAALVLHASLWWGLPLALGIGVGRVAIVYVLPLFFLGPYLAAIFWVNHVGMPLIDNPERFSFLEHQVVTSRTVTNPRMMDWFFGGLNYQIEHHLYPQIPSFRLRKVQTIVQPTLEKSGIPYHAVSFWAAVKEIAVHFHYVSRG
jgi:fatty acid desaturase